MSRHISYLLLSTFATVLLLVGCSKDGKDDSSSKSQDYKYLTEVVKEYTVSKTDMANALVAQIPSLQQYSAMITGLLKDVKMVDIKYKTTNVDGNSVVASGVIAIPLGTTTYDHIVSIQHGTADIDDAPSKQKMPLEMAPVVSGHVVAMADYLGYGASQTSDRQHPYLHVKYTGIACADMIEAAREYLNSKGISETSDKIQLLGYSQGGQATVATLLELESRGEASRITGVFAGGGPYDLEATFKVMTSTNGYAQMGYVPYLIRGIEYGEQLSLDDSKIYAPEVINKGLTTMFSTKPLSTWHSALGVDITKVLNADFFVGSPYNGNADVQKLMAAVKKNSLVNYTPKTAVSLFHSKTDDYVPYVNAENAHAKWTNSTLTVLASDGHVMGGVEFMLRYMGIWSIIQPILSTQTKAEMEQAIDW
jgi:pimeloyl-ACP methyl ester carboxylesterase